MPGMWSEGTSCRFGHPRKPPVTPRGISSYALIGPSIGRAVARDPPAMGPMTPAWGNPRLPPHRDH